VTKDSSQPFEVGLPPTAGLGMGIDRAGHVAHDSPSIRDVIAFPLMRPSRPVRLLRRWRWRLRFGGADGPHSG